MALRTTILVFFVAMAFLGTCSCASTSGAVYRAGVVYHVGDSGGWSIIADYNSWASKEDFHVGDILIFGKMFHSLTQVNGEDYQSCNTKSPIKVYATGSDAITLTKPGDYYFIGGRNLKSEWYGTTLKKPGRCQAGEKNSHQGHSTDTKSSFGCKFQLDTNTLVMVPRQTPSNVFGPPSFTVFSFIISVLCTQTMLL